MASYSLTAVRIAGHRARSAGQLRYGSAPPIRYRSISMKYFADRCPPLAGLVGCQGFLHGLAEGPPLLCLGIRRHPGHIPVKISADVLEIREQQGVVAE